MSAQLAEPFLRLGDYLKWAQEEHGCRIQTGVSTGPERMTTFTVVIAPSEKHVVILDVAEDEYIPISMYRYYDRRLGLKSEHPYYSDKAAVIKPF